MIFSEDFIEEAKKHKKDLKRKRFDFCYYYRVPRIMMYEDQVVQEEVIEVSKYFQIPGISYSAGAYVLTPKGKQINKQIK